MNRPGLEQLASRLGELRQTVGIRLRALGGQPDERPRHAEQSRVEPRCPFGEPPLQVVRFERRPAPSRSRSRHRRTPSASADRPAWRHAASSPLPPSWPSGPGPAAPELPADRLEAVLDAEQLVLRLPRLLGAQRPVLLELRLAPLEHLDVVRQADVAQVLEVGHRVQPLRGARVARGEHQLPFLRSGRRPLQVVVGGVGRLAVLVEPEQRDVEAVARIGEIVGVAAEERGLELRREDQAHVRVLLVAVQVVQRALVQRHHLAAQAGDLLRLLLDPAHRRAARRKCFGRRHLRLDRRVHLRRHVLDALQHLELHARHLQLLRARRRVEPVLDVVLLRRAEPRDGAEAHVMVGEHQAVRRDDRPGCAPEPHRRELQVLEPLVGHLEPILLLDGRLRNVVVGPEPFVGARNGEERQHGKQNAKKRNGEFLRTISAPSMGMMRRNASAGAPGSVARKVQENPREGTLNRAGIAVKATREAMPPRAAPACRSARSWSSAGRSAAAGSTARSQRPAGNRND